MNITRTHLLSLALPLTTLMGCTSAPVISSNQKPDSDVVVIVHGLGRSAGSMHEMSDAFENAGYQTCVLEYSTFWTSIDTLFTETERQMSVCLETDKTVHFVGHSLGGLVIRYHLDNDRSLQKSNRLGRVVLIGTPNHGSDVADHYAQSFWSGWFGEVSSALVSDDHGIATQIGLPDYPFGVIAGTEKYTFTEHLFEKENDGLVSVDSTRLEGMDDYWEVNLPHHQLRYHPVVIEKVINYLKGGQFTDE